MFGLKKKNPKITKKKKKKKTNHYLQIKESVKLIHLSTPFQVDF